MRSYLLLLIFFLPFFSGAQEPVLKNFSTRNGLPSNEVYFLHQDKKGFIWICTDAGLVRYNGNYFTRFYTGNGMPDNSIFEVKEDRQGRIWFRSYSGKIGYIFNDSVVSIATNAGIEKFIKDGIVCSFAIDKNGTLFLGKRNSDHISFLRIRPPYSLHNTEEIWRDTSFESGCKIISIGENDFVFSDKRVGKGLYSHYSFSIYDDQNHKLITDEFSVPESHLFTRVFRKKNIFYFTANCVVKKADIIRKTIANRSFKTNVITTVVLDSNTVMAGERHGGIDLFSDDFNKEPFDSFLKGLTFTYAVKDYQGGYWFGTLESGVFYMPSDKISFSRIGHDDEESITHLNTCSDSSLLIGLSSGRVVTAGSSTSGRFIFSDMAVFSKEQMNSIIGGCRPDPDHLIVSGSHAAMVLDSKTGKAKFINSKNLRFIYFIGSVMYEDSLMVTDFRNIFVFSKNDYRTAHSAYKTSERLTAIAYDRGHQQIYVGTLRGLYRYTPGEPLREKDQLLAVRIEDLKIASGNLLIATNGEGLIIRSGSRYDTINEQKGLISNICKAIAADENVIWVSTNIGLSKVTLHANGRYDISNYELRSQIDAASISGIRILKGRVYFSAGSKLYSFSTSTHPTDTRFYISSFRVNEKPYSTSLPAELDHDQSGIRIGYEALFYNCNTTISYRYKLTADGTEWNYTKETKAIFPNLAPGSYEFIVQAMDSEGRWIEADHHLSFVIRPPFWQRTWFIAAVIFAVIALISIGLRYRYLRVLRQELGKNEQRMRMYELESKAVKAQMNPHFIFNSLSSIQEFILSDNNESAYRYLSKFSKLVRRLLESNALESVSLETEIDILKHYLEIEALRFREAFSYEFSVEEGLSLSQILIPHMMIQPFVENAIWHGLLHKKGEKKLEVRFRRLNADCLSCEIEDNGVGRHFKKNDAPVLQKKSLAIEFISQRLSLMSKVRSKRYAIGITDKKDGSGEASGTIVKIEIPILNH